MFLIRMKAVTGTEEALWGGGGRAGGEEPRCDIHMTMVDCGVLFYGICGLLSSRSKGWSNRKEARGKSHNSCFFF